MSVTSYGMTSISSIVDIASSKWYYKLASSTPAKPTDNNDPPTGWSATEPSYTAGSTDSLYVVNKVIYGDGTFEYSDVSLYSSFSAAKDAAKTATNYLSYNSSTGLDVSYTGTNAKTRIKGSGVEIFDGSGDSVAYFGTSNNSPVSRIGDETSGHVLVDIDSIDIMDGSTTLASFGANGVVIGTSSSSHSVVDSSGMRIYSGNGNVQLANLGYGIGASQSGTATAPFYTFGLRELSSTVGNYSVAEGYETVSSAWCSHSEGAYTYATGGSAHAEGNLTSASGSSSHAEGVATISSGQSSHAEGVQTTASGDYSHAEGNTTVASGECSHSEGINTNAVGNYSHSEGGDTNALDSFCHAEGCGTTASGPMSHAEGDTTVASGDYAHAEGRNTEASGSNSHAQNYGTIASGAQQTAIGCCNIGDNSNTYLFIIGNGESTTSRSNALTVDWNGSLRAYGEYQDAAGATIFQRNKGNDSAHTEYPIFWNNQYILRLATKTTSTSSTGAAFILGNGMYAAGGSADGSIDITNTAVYLAGGCDATSRYITSPVAYLRTYNAAANMYVTVNGYIGRSTSSSIRYKHDVSYITNSGLSVVNNEKKITDLKSKNDSMDSVLDIPIVTFKYNDGYVTGEQDFDYEKPIAGFIAEDVAAICPECATYIEDENGELIPESWDAKQFIIRMLYVLQKQQKEIETLKEKINE